MSRRSSNRTSEPHLRVFALAERPPTASGAGPIHVARAPSVTRLAPHADFGEARREAVLGDVVVLAHAGRMTLGAHEIPVLVQLGPVQEIVVLDLFVGVEMEPALAALVLRPRVPGERQRLQPAVREFDEILLQGIDAESVFHLEGGELAVGPVGLDQELAVLAEEARMHSVIVEAGIVEISEHRLVGRMVHRVLVLGGLPPLRLGAVAAGAGLAAHEGRWCRGRVGTARPRRLAQPVGGHIKSETAGDGDRGRDRRRDPDAAPRVGAGFRALRRPRASRLCRGGRIDGTLLRSALGRRLARFACHRHRPFGMRPWWNENERLAETLEILSMILSE